MRWPSPRKSEDGKARRSRGRRAELVALLALMMRGWRPVARNLKTPVGEIDLVMRRGSVLAVIEVKTRAQYAEAAESILPQQQARIARATEWLLSQRPDLAALTIRFDAVLVTPGRWPKHLVDAYSRP
ncbi:MAG: YraN family protein [Alphaproteobacteria bacterium]|nr:YraN family protein [Alphaproteobacteria bacterium]